MSEQIDFLKLFSLMVYLSCSTFAGIFALLTLFPGLRGPNWKSEDIFAGVVFALLAIAWKP